MAVEAWPGKPAYWCLLLLRAQALLSSTRAAAVRPAACNRLKHITAAICAGVLGGGGLVHTVLLVLMLGSTSAELCSCVQAPGAARNLLNRVTTCKKRYEASY